MKIPGSRRSLVQQCRLCFRWKRLPVTKGCWCFFSFLVSKAQFFFWCNFFCCERFWLYILFGCKRFDSCVLESLFVVQVPGVKMFSAKSTHLVWRIHDQEAASGSYFASGVVYVFLLCFIFHFCFPFVFGTWNYCEIWLLFLFIHVTIDKIKLCLVLFLTFVIFVVVFCWFGVTETWIPKGFRT